MGFLSTMFDAGHKELKRCKKIANAVFSYEAEYRELTDKYQKIYGPLTIHFPCNKWRWIEEPWPWERGNF